jgi:hypothetical protein
MMSLCTEEQKLTVAMRHTLKRPGLSEYLVFCDWGFVLYED